MCLIYYLPLWAHGLYHRSLTISSPSQHGCVPCWRRWLDGHFFCPHSSLLTPSPFCLHGRAGFGRLLRSALNEIMRSPRGMMPALRRLYLPPPPACNTWKVLDLSLCALTGAASLPCIAPPAFHFHLPSAFQQIRELSDSASVASARAPTSPAHWLPTTPRCVLTCQRTCAVAGAGVRRHNAAPGSFSSSFARMRAVPATRYRYACGRRARVAGGRYRSVWFA